MSDPDLRPADNESLLLAIMGSLKRVGGKPGRRTRFSAEIDEWAETAARKLIEDLKRGNFVVMQGPPVPQHSSSDISGSRR